eukprot:gene17514-17714_t
MRVLLDKEALVSSALRKSLAGLLDELATTDLYESQERYVLLFDRTRSLSLHIFEHVHGESRDRGQAMIDLKTLYEQGGFAISAQELPDYLPLFLEYCATQPLAAALELLGQPAHIFTALAERLHKRNTPYEAVLRVLIALAKVTPRAEELEALRAEVAVDPDDMAALDAAWEEEAVTFGPGADGKGAQTAMGACGTDALAARMRHARLAMSAFLNHLAFGWYPYLALTVFLVASLIRFDREQYSWKSSSSQLLRRKQLIWGSNLFHVGILVIFAGHFFGLLTPIWIFDALGISHSFKQGLAIGVGGLAGAACFVGIAMLTHRRLTDPRIRKNSSTGDILVLLLLFAQLTLGLSTLSISLANMDGHEMVKFMGWAQGILTLQPGASELVADVHPIFKAHLLLGMTIFLVFPFTRLVHVWSAPVWYLGRKGYQIVRSGHSGARGKIFPSKKSASKVSVNGVAIPREAIAREAQHHPAKTPSEAFALAAKALVIRQLLLDEARRLGFKPTPLTDDEGRFETDDEALVRQLVEAEVKVPQPDEATVRRYFEQNRKRFRSPDIFEVEHILFAADPSDKPARVKAETEAAAVLAVLQANPAAFAEFARSHSACNSAQQGGNLGQVTRGTTTPEFDKAMAAQEPGTLSAKPVESRYGYHIIRVVRRFDGLELPFELMVDCISAYLAEAVERRAITQYIGILAGEADIQDMLRNLQDEAQATEILIGMNDLVRISQVQTFAAQYDETAGEYAANAVRGFANQASDEDWLALTTAIENADDAAQIWLHLRRSSPMTIDIMQWPLAVLHSHEGEEGGLVLAYCARLLKDSGFGVAGMIQTDVPVSGQRKCNMFLEDLSTGQTMCISQFRGNEARGCRLDHAALAQAVVCVEQAVMHRPQLLVLNKFGKEEAQGRGFLPVIAEALSQGIPVLTCVSALNAAVCEQQLGAMRTLLRPRASEILHWCYQAMGQPLHGARAAIIRMYDVILARALHVLAVVHWIGGLAFVTLIILPMARQGAGMALFQAVEQRFSAQVRVSVPLAGASGLWMTYRLDLWARFNDPHFWWMSAMLGLWLIFMLLLFIIEPLFHHGFKAPADARIASDEAAPTLRKMAVGHKVLLLCAALTVLGAVAGAQGFDPF